MAKTTNILDLNNRLEKVEKENEAQNNYNSLRNRPKINGNLLTGDKTSTQLGLADAQDIIALNEKFVIEVISSGDVSDLIAAGGYKLYSLNVSKTGYIPVGIMGIYKQGTNQSNCTIAYFRIREDNSVYYSDCMLQNNSSVDSTITKIEFTVFYKKEVNE